jgi:hypothetical protein
MGPSSPTQRSGQKALRTIFNKTRAQLVMFHRAQ